MTPTPQAAAAVARKQVPAAGQLNIDHVAHFVPHIDSASTALERLGFTLTPFSAQSHRLEHGGPLLPAGTGNRCVMFKQGYLEFLTPTGDTPVANQLRAAIKRYVGVHVVAFGTATPDIDHARLARHGFEPMTPIALERRIGTPEGEDTARFTVVRVAPGKMAEGRIQFCQHHTPHLLWQSRWLAHANHAAALAGVLIASDEPQATAQRYARYTGLLAHLSGGAWRIDTARGCLLFVEPALFERKFDASPPAVPCIAGYVLASENLAATRDYLAEAGFRLRDLGPTRFFVALPPSVGGLVVFEAPHSPALNLTERLAFRA